MHLAGPGWAMVKPRGNSYATKRDVFCEKLTRHVSPRTYRVSSEFEIFNGDREVRDNRDGWIVPFFLLFFIFLLLPVFLSSKRRTKKWLLSFRWRFYGSEEIYAVTDHFVWIMSISSHLIRTNVTLSFEKLYIISYDTGYNQSVLTFSMILSLFFCCWSH